MNNSELRHPHVILLIGACTEPSKPLCVVTEYMLNGSLFDVIHVRRVNLPLYMKLSIAKVFIIIHISMFVLNIILIRFLGYCSWIEFLAQV